MKTAPLPVLVCSIPRDKRVCRYRKSDNSCNCTSCSYNINTTHLTVESLEFLKARIQANEES